MWQGPAGELRGVLALAVTACLLAVLLGAAPGEGEPSSGEEEFYTCQHYYNSSLWLPRRTGRLGDDDDDDENDDDGRDDDSVPGHRHDDDDEEVVYPSQAAYWCSKGSYFTFDSLVEPGLELELFWFCEGGEGVDDAETVVFLHGWPTSSFDFLRLAEALWQEAPSLRLCFFDSVGYGFSAKPRNYSYSLFEDAYIVDHFVREVAQLDHFMLYTHDKGDSVGLQFLNLYLSTFPPYEITHHFLSNGNMFLPLANLTATQELLLDYDVTIPPYWMASGCGDLLYSPPLNDSEVWNLESTFQYLNGTAVLHDTIQYLAQRAVYEDVWLNVLNATNVPATELWGLLDTVSPPRVGEYVFARYLAHRSTAPADYFTFATANHYVQHDAPLAVAQVVLQESGRNATAASPT